mmetsp:Transcript_33489/g.104393  ORF Transcript_33489/g.104393 Transcript_33489/m.104393 type:complete len:206 (-) Transcript_33489:22-639(-)
MTEGLEHHREVVVLQPLLHLWRRRQIGAKPVCIHDRTARLQHTRHLGVQRLLVRSVQECVLAEDNVKRGVGKGPSQRVHSLELHPVLEAQLGCTDVCLLNDLGLQVDTNHARGAALLGEEQGRPAPATANLQNRLVLEVHAAHDIAGLLGAARRDEVLTPQGLPSLHGIIGILKLQFLVASTHGADLGTKWGRGRKGGGCPNLML